MAKSKIPVRIVQAKDIHGNKKVGVMLDISYYQETPEDADGKLNKFRNLYFETIDEAQKLYRRTKRHKGNSKYYWQLSRLLKSLNERIENDFIVTNYKAALERDFRLTDSYIGVIFDFADFFQEGEVLNEVPMSVYFELTIKTRKLQSLGLFEKEKMELMEMVKRGKVIGHKEYRKMLSDLIREKTDARNLSGIGTQ